jgi:hypothetical protein
LRGDDVHLYAKALADDCGQVDIEAFHPTAELGHGVGGECAIERNSIFFLRDGGSGQEHGQSRAGNDIFHKRIPVLVVPGHRIPSPRKSATTFGGWEQVLVLGTANGGDLFGASPGS